jgi:hypothetical protein
MTSVPDSQGSGTLAARRTAGGLLRGLSLAGMAA